MNKLIITAALLFSLVTAKAQQTITRCGTPEPGANWDAWFNQKVSDYKQTHSTRTITNYTIPVIVHIISAGETIGTGKNISAAQVNSQISVLNADYSGNGFNVGNVPTVFSGLVANTGIQFCTALRDPSGVTLSEPGIDRITDVSLGFTSSNTGYTQAYIDATIKPATIWDPNKYLNIWVVNISGGLLGYALFPTGTGLTGITGGGTSTTDGVVILYNAFGNTGIVSAPYDKGRSATHEISHWLGLRHIGGDASCGTDYCNDTPAQVGTSNGQNFGCPTHPLVNAGECGGTTAEMFMNFLDYTDDACMYMFTPDQTTRIQTCMQLGTYRASLGTHGLCQNSPLASFTPSTNTACVGQPVNFNNTSIGAATYEWSISGTVLSTAANFSYSFTGAGSAGVQLIVTDGIGGADTAYSTITINPSPNITLTNNGPACVGQSPITVTATGGHTYSWSGPNGPIFNPSSVLAVGIGGPTISDSGYYSVIVTDTITGCSQMDSSLVVVNKVDNASFQYWGSYICDNSGLFHTNIYGLPGGTFSAPVGVVFVNANGSINPATSSPGNYIVTYATNGACPSSSTDTIDIFVAPTLNFTTGLSCTGAETQFTDASISPTGSGGGITTYMWDFGDGNTSNLQSPTHIYSAVGTYNITLSAVTNQGCSNTINQSITTQPSPAPGFTAPSVCFGDVTNFSNTSTVPGGTVVSTTWNFGDGVSSNVMNPSYTYVAPGFYNVQLIVTSDLGCPDTMTQSIIVNALPSVFAGTDVSICPGNSASLFASGAINYIWLDGNTQVANVAFLGIGPSVSTVYTVFGTDVNGCSNSDNVLVTVNELPSSNFLSSGNCANSSTSFTNYSTISGGTIVSYIWDFGDGATSTSVNPTHIYAAGGSYNATLTAISDSNCVGNYTTTVIVDGVPFIYGSVSYDSLGTLLPISKGEVTLYSVDINKDIISSVTVAVSNGSYYFDNFNTTGYYVILSSPDSARYYPNIVPQYSNNVTVWNSATVNSITCGATFTQNIQHNYLLSNMGGTGTISGYVYKPHGRRPGEPVIGVDVSVDQVPGGMQAMRTTDTTGYYEFNNVPDGTFILLVNIPGKPMDSTYTITMNSAAGDIVDTNLVFFVDSNTIFISDSIMIVSGVKNSTIAIEKNWISVSPNPTNSNAVVKIKTEENDFVKINVLTGSGLNMSTVQDDKVSKGDYLYTIDKDKLNLSSGIYYIRVTTKLKTQTLKLIVK